MIYLIHIIAATMAAYAGGWTEAPRIGVRTDNSIHPTAIFVNTYTGAGEPSGQWNRLDVTTLDIPREAKSVFLAGILIITHGYEFADCDLTIAFRAPGDALKAGNYIGQVIEPFIGGGQRSTMATWTPVRDGQIEYFWQRNTYKPWPDGCAYGINLSAQAYVIGGN